MPLTTDPASGVVSGAPGATVGWGFTLTATDTNYYVLNNVFFCIGGQLAPTCPDLATGTFTDIAAAIHGVIIGPAFSPSPYSEPFAAGVSGLGSYTIAAGAADQTLVGKLYVYFDTYDGIPGDLGVSQIGANDFIFHSAEVDVVSAIPEAGSLTLLTLILAVILLGRVSVAGSFRAALHSGGVPRRM
jgi:hypothetical protein